VKPSQRLRLRCVVDASGISMPTFYNFYNANRGYFKKVKRGQFEIIDPNAEREKDK
jgi:predicted DNA-binding transcriptional regulator AlpA